MNASSAKARLITVALTLGCGLASTGLAGEAKKWEQIPEAVRKTILANGGSTGSVDLEGERLGGKAVYEASAKDKSGKVVDLVVSEDGQLVAVKTDDAADRAQERAAARNPGPALPKFSRPREITHPYLPLALVKQDILEGKEDGQPTRVERTARPEIKKTFKLGKQTIQALVFEDRDFEAGKLAELTRDYFAQSDDGTVYYLGEEVDDYKEGKVTGHEGTWLLGKHTKTPGILLPPNPKVGDKFKSEDVPGITTEEDEVISVSETVTVPAGTYRNCLKVKEVLSDGKTEYKYYAPGVGCIKEVPQEGELVLVSHVPNAPAK